MEAGPWEPLRKKAVGGLTEVRLALCCVLSKGGKSLLEAGQEPWLKLGPATETAAAAPVLGVIAGLQNLWWRSGGQWVGTECSQPP